ncbi:hypothetical protein C8J56DRAFT_934707 [Mycena floridula]|nr:hypothetical protein C8J56DRAFT_934707 [Mycena floridula]
MLPPELFCSILETCSVHDIVRCRELCRSFKSIIDASSSLQYKIQLAVAGLQPTAGQKLPASTLLQTLQKYQDAWKNFKWTAKTTVRLSDIETWEVTGNLMAYYSLDRGLFTFKQIASLYREIPLKEWSFAPQDHKVSDFTIDPTQDLLVAVHVDIPQDHHITVSVYLSAFLDSDSVHPSAGIPVHLIHRPAQDVVADSVSFEIRISGCHVGIMLDVDGETELIILNWKTGQIHHQAFPVHLTTFAFLTSDLLMIGHIVEPGDDVYLPQLTVFKLKSPSQIDKICSFCLPAPLTGVNTYFDVCMDTAATSLPLNSPFTTSQTDRLLVINYTLFGQDELEENFAIFAPCSTFQRQIDALPISSSTPRSFSWAEWGPNQTRMLPYTMEEVWCCYVHGMKALISVGENEFVLCDFNPLGPKQDDFPWKLTDLNPEHVRLLQPCNLETSLPYSQTAYMIESTEALMLSEDALIAITFDDNIEIMSF